MVVKLNRVFQKYHASYLQIGILLRPSDSCGRAFWQVHDFGLEIPCASVDEQIGPDLKQKTSSLISSCYGVLVYLFQSCCVLTVQ